jgi:hypothetical protein
LICGERAEEVAAESLRSRAGIFHLGCDLECVVEIDVRSAERSGLGDELLSRRSEPTSYCFVDCSLERQPTIVHESVDRLRDIGIERNGRSHRWIIRSVLVMRQHHFLPKRAPPAEGSFLWKGASCGASRRIACGRRVPFALRETAARVPVWVQTLFADRANPARSGQSPPA